MCFTAQNEYARVFPNKPNAIRQLSVNVDGWWFVRPECFVRANEFTTNMEWTNDKCIELIQETRKTLHYGILAMEHTIIKTRKMMPGKPLPKPLIALKKRRGRKWKVYWEASVEKKLKPSLAWGLAKGQMISVCRSGLPSEVEAFCLTEMSQDQQ
ncbi:hypothetical protein PR048_020149 [Dryococelus australis]|uniref:Uncharacterized protein n=1 Tax=Dryococelus australis TaxID=614101 RepID=A0ABQ9H5H2_9NEOP|nr:hypothetical protein PR048_020149 [Dryococelus australis]